MDVTQPITRSFADEHVIGIDPPLRPDLNDGGPNLWPNVWPNVWRRRINAFAGRALSAKAMSAEQALRSGMQRLYGVSRSPGIAEGLAVSSAPAALGAPPASAFLQIAPGIGIARSGEDIQIGHNLRLALGDMPVILRADQANVLAGTAPAAEIPVGGLPQDPAARLRPESPRRLGDTLATIAANPASAALGHVAVLVARPIAAEILGRPLDPCAPDPRDDAYVDLQRIDGTQLALYLWPAEMLAIAGGPDYTLVPAGPAQRNLLAHAVFANEALLSEDQMHPWEAWGLPLALIGFAADWTLNFVDRAAVARIGGTPKDRTPVAAGTGGNRLWQARLDQFTAQLADLPALDAATLQAAFQRLPPVGVLPPTMFDPSLRIQHFFPSGYHVNAVPLALSNLNLVIAEAAGLAPLDRGYSDAVELLVPVPDEVYEPGLLQIEAEDPRFGQAIETLRDHRNTALILRQMGRRRYDRLSETVSGAVMGWPASDLPLEENTPAPHVQVPVEVTRTRRFGQAAAGASPTATLHSHALVGASATLTVNASDTIWVWVCVHDATLLTGLSLGLGTGTGADGTAVFAKSAFWGADTGLPVAAGLQATGPLPEQGIWTRLEVSGGATWDANGATLDGYAINGAEFAQFGGDVEWGAFGKADATQKIFTYLADDAPAGSVLTGDGGAAGWPWTPVPRREQESVPDFGTQLTGDVRRAVSLDAFRARWPQAILQNDLARIDEDGIGAFLTAVDARLKATNDAIDLGFVRARSDIYRVRQIMLGADAASRLVTSPSLSDLALRDEGARATSQEIGAFLTASATANVVVTPPPTPTPTPTQRGPTPTPTPTRPSASVQDTTNFSSRLSSQLLRTTSFQPTEMTLNIQRTGSFAAPSPAANTRVSPAAAAFENFSNRSAGSQSPLTRASYYLPGVSTDFSGTPIRLQSPAAASYSVAGSQALGLGNARYGYTDIQRQIPIAGLVERTVSVAERLTPQPAVQALDYALASKGAVVTTLTGLTGQTAGRPLGITLGDIPMAGFDLAGRQKGDPPHTPTLDQLLADRTRSDGQPQVYADADTLPDAQSEKHESDYFTAAVQAIDNSIAIMRLVEGRIAMFDELAASARDLLRDVNLWIDQAAAWLRAIDVEVTEVRHDLGTAEMLRAEEDARIAAVNLRRAGILNTHVTVIAWRRERAADVGNDLPLIAAAAGLAPDAVAICQREHADTPDEIHDYVQLLREVPLAWFPALAAMIPRILRIDSAREALYTMVERAASPYRLAAADTVTARGRYLIGVQNALVAARATVATRRAEVAGLDYGRISQLALSEAQQQLTLSSTIGDVMTGSHRQPALTRAAAALIDGIAAISGCLHESFGDIAPAIRLAWAETLAEFGRPAPLQSLAGLAAWAQVPIASRRTLQSFVDWLFAQIDPGQPAAVDAINELVRICLLMAAHSPVDRLIPAQLVTPVPARIGGRLFLSLDIHRVRIGMLTLVRDEAGAIVSRGVIADIGDGQAQASITHLLSPITTFTPAMRVELVSGVLR